MERRTGKGWTGSEIKRMTQTNQQQIEAKLKKMKTKK